MSNQSTVVEWLNENALRSYPLTEDSPRFVYSGLVKIDLNALVLDATLFYDTIPTSTTLDMIVTSGSNLVIYVAGQLSFMISNYQTATYPYYVRNLNNSLLVIGDASTIPTNLVFNVGSEFEPCVLYAMSLSKRTFRYVIQFSLLIMSASS